MEKLNKIKVLPKCGILQNDTLGLVGLVEKVGTFTCVKEPKACMTRVYCVISQTTDQCMYSVLTKCGRQICNYSFDSYPVNNKCSTGN